MICNSDMFRLNAKSCVMYSLNFFRAPSVHISILISRELPERTLCKSEFQTMNFFNPWSQEAMLGLSEISDELVRVVVL
jgi:hypothetical protein